MKILIICGHGDGDPGACAFDYQESTLVREAAPKLKSILSNYAEVTLFDVNKNMYKYLKSGNSFNFKEYDYVFEWHFNACVNDTTGDGRTTGTEILVHPLENGTSVEELILKNIEKLGFKNRGVKTRTNLQNMNICKKKQGVSYALLETCFIDDFDDISLYNLKKNDIIKAIAEGIIKGFKLNQFRTDVQSSMNKTEPLTSANDITWELNHSYFPITEMKKFVQELDEAKSKNSSLYWGFYKLVNKIK
jgi:N-acetylmuramoyl-L-alanine amidase